VIGAGKIGSALVHYRGFEARGFEIRWVFDHDPAKVGTSWNGVKVRDVAHLERDLAAERPAIAILAIPAEGAQSIADRLTRLGIRAILNFAPVQLTVPDDVAVKNVNMALELETLSYALRNR
jgi:redox-sensing transcriptional repressor